MLEKSESGSHMKHWKKYGVVLVLLLGQLLGRSQSVTVTGRVELIPSDPAHQGSVRGSVAKARDTKLLPAAEDRSNVVVWLTPLDSTSDKNLASAPAAFPHAQLLQKDKSFKPHLLVIPAGTVVDFPNRDPFFHNVFSYFEGKRFDLGLYESGSSRSVRFDHPGISYIFCNIHPEMSAVVVAMPTRYYAVSDRAGQIGIPGVPAGRYTLHVWHERSLPEVLKNLTREIVVSEGSSSLGTLRLVEAGNLYQTHKNKYGRDYDSAEPVPPTYNH
jgi:plastocyanin